MRDRYNPGVAIPCNRDGSILDLFRTFRNAKAASSSAASHQDDSAMSGVGVVFPVFSVLTQPFFLLRSISTSARSDCGLQKPIRKD